MVSLVRLRELVAPHSYRFVLLLLVCSAVMSTGVWALDRCLLYPASAGAGAAQWWRTRSGKAVDPSFMFFWVSFFIALLTALWLAATMGWSRFSEHVRDNTPVHWLAKVGSAVLIFLSMTILYWVTQQREGAIAFVGPFSSAVKIALVFAAGMIFFPSDRPTSGKPALAYAGVASILVGLCLMAGYTATTDE